MDGGGKKRRNQKENQLEYMPLTARLELSGREAINRVGVFRKHSLGINSRRA
jgi:hypothetical protein